MKKTILLALLTITLVSCNQQSKKTTTESTSTYSEVKVIGVMKNVMWKGELAGSISLDTITNKKGLYGLGPVSYLTGEVLINNGNSYVSRVTSSSTMTVEKTYNVSAPFFVYTHVSEWNEIALPATVKTIQDVEQFIDEKTKDYKRPFAFKLIGEANSAVIHIQNLPEGTKVSSPTEAHQGQTNYTLENEILEIIGFFSTEHKGIFTHHDSFIHMHAINKDESKMGHLDTLTINNMKLYLPKK